jgi:hypothetical protein
LISERHPLISLISFCKPREIATTCDDRARRKYGQHAAVQVRGPKAGLQRDGGRGEAHSLLSASRPRGRQTDRRTGLTHLWHRAKRCQKWPKIARGVRENRAHFDF